MYSNLEKDVASTRFCLPYSVSAGQLDRIRASFRKRLTALLVHKEAGKVLRKVVMFIETKRV